MILTDSEIVERVKIYQNETDFKPKKSSPGKRIISKGLSSFGYDLTLGPKVQQIMGGSIDPKDFNTNFVKMEDLRVFNDIEGIPDYVVMPPNSFALAYSLEELHIPPNVIGICVGKSTYARCGLIINVTPLEPEWRGQVTLELHNTSRASCKVYLYEGICQVNFHMGATPRTTYSGKNGKYQDQQGIVYPKG